MSLQLDALMNMRQTGKAGLAVDTAGLPSLGRLSEGDTLSGRVIFAGDGTVNVKTDGGVLLRARLEGTAELQLGQEVELRVVDADGDRIYLVVEGGDKVVLSGPSMPGGSAPAGQAPPADVSNLMDLLGRLGYPADRQTAEAVLELLTRYPDMPPEEAALLAANRIPEGEIPAARALLSGAVTADALLTDLSRTVQRTMPEITLSANWQVNLQNRSPETVRLQVLADLLGVPLEGLPEGDPAGETARPLPVGQPAGQVGRETAGMPAEARPEQADGGGERPRVVTPRTPQPQENMGQAPAGPETAAGERAGPRARPVEGQMPAEAARPAMPGGGDREAPLVRQTVHLLRQLSQLDGVPDKVVTRLARALAGAVTDLVPEAAGDRDRPMQPARLLMGLFAEPQADPGRAAAKLQAAREELGVRLAVLNSLADSKGPVAQQAHRAMEHTQVQNRLDQFCYVQLPIRLEGQRKSADLYVYKNKKGPSGRIDPENARMLLALDMERLGHLEAFVTVRGRDVSLQVSLAREEAVPFIQGLAPGLFKLLGEAGFRLGETRVQKLESKTEPTDAFSPCRLAERGRGRGVDFVV